MEPLYLVIDTLAIASLLVLATSFVLSAPTRNIAGLIIWLAVSYVCYVLSARHDYAFAIPPDLQIDLGAAYMLVNLARNSISATLLLLTHSLFREERRFPRAFIALILLQLFLEEPLAWLLSADWEQTHPEIRFILYEFVPACLQVFFIGIATVWAVGELRPDLVGARRRARILMLCLVVGQGLLSVLIERIGFSSGLVPLAPMYPIHNLLVTVQILIFAVFVFWLLRRDLLDFLKQEPPQAAEVSADAGTASKEVERIRNALEVERIYQQMGLTVADLAKHVALPQYRLRDLIHNELGFRNFNSFLHHYRIEEVALALEDADQNQTPILTLALSAGYQSINPFNRAFKELKGMTPSDYRASRQQ